MLSRAACRVVGIESNGITISELFGQLETTPKITKWCGRKPWQHDRRSVFEGDFFELTPDNLGPVSQVYDRATLVALPADMRTRYADRVTSLINAAPQLLVRFEYDPAHMSGSPFAVPPPQNSSSCIASTIDSRSFLAKT